MLLTRNAVLCLVMFLNLLVFVHTSGILYYSESVEHYHAGRISEQLTSYCRGTAGLFFNDSEAAMDNSISFEHGDFHAEIEGMLVATQDQESFTRAVLNYYVVSPFSAYVGTLMKQ